MRSLNEADRLREYERRLQSARKAECDIGNVTARTIDHWHRIGWYNLFYQRYACFDLPRRWKADFVSRWQGDPATTRPSQSRNTPANGSNSNAVDESDDNPHINFSDSMIMPNGINTSNLPTDRTSHQLAYINPQSLREPTLPPAMSPIMSNQRSGTGASVLPNAPASLSASAGPSNLEQQQPMMNLVIPQTMLQAYLQYLQVQTQTGKMKLEYMRRREEREEKESAQRREAERLRMEREEKESAQRRDAERLRMECEEKESALQRGAERLKMEREVEKAKTQQKTEQAIVRTF